MDTRSPVPWRGFHHVALVTPDLDATIRFYRDVLGMHAGDIYATGRGVAGRHCFITPGDGETWGMHFFENPAPDLAGALAASGRMVLETGWRPGHLPGILQHLAFALPDEGAALDLRERLGRHDVPTTPINAIGPLRNFLFLDNNGLLLEAAWPNL